MSAMLCVTRENSEPEGKSQVYFTSSPNDFERYSKSIFKKILDVQDCAINSMPDFITEWEDIEEMEGTLSDMQLIVAPITHNLFSADDPCWASSYELPYADEHGIPILGIIYEEGLESIFTESYENGIFIDQTDISVTHDPELFETQFKMDVSYILSGGNVNSDDVREAEDKYLEAYNSLFEPGNSFTMEGNYRMAEKTWREMLSISESYNLIDDQFGNRWLFVQPYLNLGVDYFYQKDYEKAETYTNKAWDMHNKMGKFANMSEYTIIWSRVNEMLGDIQNAKGNYPDALNQYEISATYQLLVVDQSNDLQERRNLIELYYKLGDTVMKGIPDKACALDYYAVAGKQINILYRETQNDSEYQKNSATFFRKMGDVYYTVKDFNNAMDAYQFSKEYNRSLCEASDLDYFARRAAVRDLSVDYHKIGITYISLGNLPEAEKYFRQCIKLREQIYDSMENDFQADGLKEGLYLATSIEQSRDDLYECYTSLSKLMRQEGRDDEAEKFEQKANNLNGN